MDYSMLLTKVRKKTDDDEDDDKVEALQMDENGVFVLKRLESVTQRKKKMAEIEEEDEDSLEQDYYSDEEKQEEEKKEEKLATQQSSFENLREIRNSNDTGFGGMTFDSLDGEYTYRVGVIDFLT